MDTQLIRCFIAIHLPDEIKTQISTFLDELRKLSKEVRWVNVDNLHLTLKFLGEIESARVDKIKENLSPLCQEFSKFTLKIAGTGCFPNRRKPRVFWLGMEQSKENPLFSMHKWIETNLENLGFEKEKRRFSPHLTLGRVRAKHTVDFTYLFNHMDSIPFTPVDLDVENISFMQSRLKPTGAEYSIIESYPLK